MIPRHRVVATMLTVAVFATYSAQIWTTRAAGGDGDADFVLHADRIWTGAPTRPWADDLRWGRVYEFQFWPS